MLTDANGCVNTAIPCMQHLYHTAQSGLVRDSFTGGNINWGANNSSSRNSSSFIFGNSSTNNGVNSTTSSSFTFGNSSSSNGINSSNSNSSSSGNTQQPRAHIGTLLSAAASGVNAADEGFTWDAGVATGDDNEDAAMSPIADELAADDADTATAAAATGAATSGFVMPACFTFGSNNTLGSSSSSSSNSGSSSGLIGSTVDSSKAGRKIVTAAARFKKLQPLG
jgi:trimeric autotransporter adhesin